MQFFPQVGDVSVFETNIRYVGGLLALFALTGDDLYKSKAVHVADKLLPAFNSPTGIPYALINMKSGVSTNSTIGVGWGLKLPSGLMSLGE